MAAPDHHAPRGPLQVLVHTHTVLPVLALSALATIALVLLYPGSYGVQSLNYAMDTPLSALLPAVLGALAACCVRSTNAGLEQLAWPRLRVPRLATVAAVCAVQEVLVALTLVVSAMTLDLSIDGTKKVLLLVSSAFWQGLCVGSAAVLRGAWMWAPPCAVLAVVIAFAYDDQAVPRWWNPVLTLSPTTVSLSAVLLALGLLAVALAPPQPPE